VDSAEDVAAVVARPRRLPGATYTRRRFESPGVIRQTGRTAGIVLANARKGTRPGVSARVRAIAEVIRCGHPRRAGRRRAGGRVGRSHVSRALRAFTGAGGCRSGRSGRCPLPRDVLEAVARSPRSRVRTGSGCGRSHGVASTSTRRAAALDAVVAVDRSSQGKRIEVEALPGELVRRGRRSASRRRHGGAVRRAQAARAGVRFLFLASATTRVVGGDLSDNGVVATLRNKT